MRGRLGKRISLKLRELFFAFWDDIDFLPIDALQDLGPDHARAVRALVGLPEGEVAEMEEAFTRLRPSPDILTRLEGLLTAGDRLWACGGGGPEPPGPWCGPEARPHPGGGPQGAMVNGTRSTLEIGRRPCLRPRTQRIHRSI